MYRDVHIALEMWAGMFCLLPAIAVTMSTDKKWKLKKNMAMLLYLGAGLLVSDATSWLFNGVTGTLGDHMVLFSNFDTFVLEQLILGTYTLFVWKHIKHNRDVKLLTRIKLIFCLITISIIIIFISQFNGMCYAFDQHNYYYRGDYYLLLIAIGIVSVILLFTIVIQYKKSFSSAVFRAILSYLILPAIALIVQYFAFGISLLNLSIAISMLAMFLVSYLTQNKMMAKMQIDLLLSQMGEHFIFNSLSTIKYLCKKNPEEASDAIDEFSNYVRTNLETLTMNHCISMKSELMHIKNYLALEKRRFGDRLNVVYNIHEEDFEIPSQAMQPLVENAIKHGICKRPLGGTITIRTEKRVNYYVITISDNGVGFDMKEVMNDGKTHIGINNVKERLTTMCAGKLIIKSEPGIGTTAKILLKINNNKG